MESVHVSQFYSCSEVSVSSELYYISELGKYLYLNYNKVLSVDGVILSSVLKKSLYWDYFRVVVSKGWVVDTNLPNSELEISTQSPINYGTSNFKNFLFTLDECVYDSVDSAERNISEEYNYTTPKPTQVCFTKMDNDAWFWTIKGLTPRDEMVNSASLNTSCASEAWVSMIAMVAVDRLMTGSPKLLGIEFPYVVAKNQLALSDFMLIMDETNAMTGWVIFSFEESVSEDIQRQVGYEAWWHKGREKGLLSKWYSPKDKLSYMKNNLDIDIGDVILLYERNYSTKFNYVKSIESCHVAIVRGISNTTLSLEVINTVKTRYGAEVSYKDQTMAVKQMYCGSDEYKKWNSTLKNYNIIDIGIEYMMYTEAYFIVPLDQADDIVKLDVKDSNGRTGKYALHQNDAIYWILKDYGIDFNEDKFLRRYFKESATAYGVFMSGNDLPSDWKTE